MMKIGEPAVSLELCGGTHINHTGELGYFVIVSESSIGAGLRRIEAVTGRGAEAFINQRLSSLEDVAKALEASPEDVEARLDGLVAELERERKRSLSLEKALAKKEAESLLGQAEVIGGVKVLAVRVESSNQLVLREMADFLRDRLRSGVVVLGAVSDGRPFFLVAVTPDLGARGYHAGNIIKQVAAVAGGGGGGRAGFAQAGGRDRDKLDEALSRAKDFIRGGG
jgi:alanyl-tRNA synthetase